MSLLQAINEHMNGGKCPAAGSLGECAALDQVGSDERGKRYEAYLYLWQAAENLSATTVAGWFHAAGARDVIVLHTLHCDLNGDRNGRCKPDGARQWIVSFSLPGL